jgi:hypothetical protein
VLEDALLDDALLDDALLDDALLDDALLDDALLVVTDVDVVKSPLVLLVEEPTTTPVVVTLGSPPAPSPPPPPGRIGSTPVAQAATSRAASPRSSAFIHRPDTLLIPMTSPPELASKKEAHGPLFTHVGAMGTLRSAGGPASNR